MGSVHATVRALIEQTLSIATLEGSEAPFSMAILPERKTDVDPAPFPPEGAEPGGRPRFPGTTPIGGAEGEVVGVTTPCCAMAVTASRNRGTNRCIKPSYSSDNGGARPTACNLAQLLWIEVK